MQKSKIKTEISFDKPKIITHWNQNCFSVLIFLRGLAKLSLWKRDSLLTTSNTFVLTSLGCWCFLLVLGPVLELVLERVPSWDAWPKAGAPPRRDEWRRFIGRDIWSGVWSLDTAYQIAVACYQLTVLEYSLHLANCDMRFLIFANQQFYSSSTTPKKCAGIEGVSGQGNLARSSKGA